MSAAPPKHDDIFKDIGAATSLGDLPGFAQQFVPGKQRGEFSVFGMGGNKTNTLAMAAALAGVFPAAPAPSVATASAAAGGGAAAAAGGSGAASSAPTWTALEGREEIGRRTFRKAEGADGFKEITQVRFRSGSIIEDHGHITADGGRAMGALMHMDRGGRIQFLDAHRRTDAVAQAKTLKPG